MSDKQRAATLRPAQIRHLLRVTAATSRFAERDTLVLLLGLTCAMRVSEIARVLVGDVLTPSGQLRKEVSLRAAITKGCRQRCIFLTQRQVIAALDRYVEHRWERGAGTELDRVRFRGLSPDTPLIVNAGVALMLYKFWSRDANMRSVWICSRNDALGNVAVIDGDYARRIWRWNGVAGPAGWSDDGRSGADWRLDGRASSTDPYEVFCAVLYVRRTGCQWRFLPNEWPKW